MFVVLYLICLILAYVFFFSGWSMEKYKRIIIKIHLVSLGCCLIVLLMYLVSDYSFYGTWIIPFFATSVITSGLFLFVLYARSSNIWLKIYGGIFFSYPLILIVLALLSRMILAFGLGLTFFVLNVPGNFYVGNGMIIREGFSGMLADSQKIELYESHFPLIKKLGETSVGSETSGQLEIDSIKVFKGKGDTIVIISEPDHRIFKFIKR